MAEVIIVETKLDSLSETPGSARASPHDYSLPVDLKFAPDISLKYNPKKNVLSIVSTQARGLAAISATGVAASKSTSRRKRSL